MEMDFSWLRKCLRVPPAPESWIQLSCYLVCCTKSRSPIFLLFYQQSLRSKRRPEVITLMFCTTTGSAGSDMSAVEEAGSEKVSVRFLNNRTFYLFPCFQNIENPRGLSGKIIRRKLKRGITRILRFWFARLRSMITRLDTRYLRLIIAKSIKQTGGKLSRPPGCLWRGAPPPY